LLLNKCFIISGNTHSSPKSTFDTSSNSPELVHVFSSISRSNGNNDTVDYIFSTKPATWDSATRACNNIPGAHLLSLETNAENQLVLGMINSNDLFEPPLPTGTTFWTSGRYNFKEKAWKWNTTSSSRFSKVGDWVAKLKQWAEGQPTQPIKESDRIALERANRNHSSWKSYASNEKAFFICEAT